MLPKFRQENQKDSEVYQRLSICLDLFFNSFFIKAVKIV